MIAAIAVAPLAVAPVLALMFGPWAIAHGGGRSLAGIISPALVVAYPTLLLFGLPMHLALVRQGATHWRAYALTGVLLGAVPVIGYYVVAVAFEAKFQAAAMLAAAAQNLEWGAIGVGVFGLSSAAVAIAFRTIVTFRHNDGTTRS